MYYIFTCWQKHCDTANLITSVSLARDQNAIQEYILQLLSLFKLILLGDFEIKDF